MTIKPDYETNGRLALLSASDIQSLIPSQDTPLSALVPIAHQTIAELMVSDISPSTRLAAAQDVLDRVGTPKRRDGPTTQQLVLNFAPEAAAKALAAMQTVFSKEAPIDVLASPSSSTPPLPVLSTGSGAGT